MRCNSGERHQVKAACTSYFGSTGSFQCWGDPNSNRANGILPRDDSRPVTVASVTDGASCTIAVGEVSGALSPASSLFGHQHGIHDRPGPDVMTRSMPRCGTGNGSSTAFTLVRGITVFRAHTRAAHSSRFWMGPSDSYRTGSITSARL